MYIVVFFGGDVFCVGGTDFLKIIGPGGPLLVKKLVRGGPFLLRKLVRGD